MREVQLSQAHLGFGQRWETLLLGDYNLIMAIEFWEL